MDTGVWEPIEESAPIARRLAAELCGSCGPYHGFWQRMRLLGLIASLRTDGPFFLERLCALAGAGSRRALVAACADYSLYAHVLAGFRRAGVEPEIAVADRCATPLALCEWYAERAGARVATVCSDLLKLELAEGFDVVCAHSVVSHLAPADRPRLFARFRELLRPGGRLVASERVYPGRSGERISRGPAEEAERVRRAAEERPDLLADPPDVLAREAEAFARSRAKLATGSGEELRALLEGAGLEVVRIESRYPDAPGPARPRLAGSVRVQYEARRPGSGA